MIIMGKQIINALVEGGRATPGPPLGPTLAPLKVNIKEIVDAINQKTKELAGMKVPVKVIVDTDTKDFEIQVGSPPTAALIKKELKIEKGSGTAGTARAGDLTMEQVKGIAKKKFGGDADPFVSQVTGTCRSMGVTIGQGTLSHEELDQAEKSRAKKEEAPPAAPVEGEAKPEDEKVTTEEPKKAPKKEGKKKKERKGK